MMAALKLGPQGNFQKLTENSKIKEEREIGSKPSISFFTSQRLPKNMK